MFIECKCPDLFQVKLHITLNIELESHKPLHSFREDMTQTTHKGYFSYEAKDSKYGKKNGSNLLSQGALKKWTIFILRKWTNI